MATITLENMEFHAYHGCLDHEKQLGNTFLVTASMELDTTLAGLTDQLSDTLNYQAVYDIIKAEMAIPSQLIEHIVQRIGTQLLEAFSSITQLTVKLTKLNPPLGGKVDNVNITIQLSR
jgi:dihydroneopterin aldolase